MTLQIELAPDEEARLLLEAAEKGMSAREYARRLIRKQLGLSQATRTTTNPPFSQVFDTTEQLDCTLELKWIEHHRDAFAGKWVALDGERLLSSGENAKEVYEAARKGGVETPFLIRIEPADELPFGGW